MFVFSPSPKLHDICIGLFCIFLIFESLAQCDNYIGKLPDKDDFYVCYGVLFGIKVDSVALMDNQELFYVFHNQGDFFQDDIIIGINQTGVYENRDKTPGKIYVTAIITETDNIGFIEFNDPCLVFSNTVSITILSQIEIEVEEICRPFIGFSFILSGGLPEYLEGSYYEVSGSHYNDKLKANEIIKVETDHYNLYNLFKYEIIVEDKNGCALEYRDLFRCSLLPIELISFEGEQTETGNLLQWIGSFSSEIDSFKIEVSKNGIDWMVIGSLNAKGTLSETSKYEFLDENLSDETCYYRLSKVNVDGTVSIIGIIEIYIPRNYLTIYPTPANNLLNVTYESISDASFDLIIYDMMGRKMFSYNEESSFTLNQTEINISHLPNNMYFLVISSNDFTASQKFVVQR